MTTPATLNTASRIIRMAFKDAGLIQDGDDPNSDQYADGYLRLYDLMNLWQTQGIKLWTLSDQAVTLTAGTATYYLGTAGSITTTKPLRVVQAYYEDSTNIRRPLNPISWEEWTRLSQVTQQGQLNSYFVDKQKTNLAVSFWLVPDTEAATGLAHLIIQNQVTTPVSLTDAIGFPIEWTMALRWGLADELATGQPQAIMQRCSQKADGYRKALEDWDVEDAPQTFVPDYRGFKPNSFA